MNNRFTDELVRRIERMCRASKEGYKASALERHRLEGFIEAGVFLGLTTNKDAQGLLETTYEQVFGRPMSERGQPSSSSFDVTVPDYSQYDTPSFVRKG